VIVDTMMWRDVIRKMKSWKAPGPDAIYAKPGKVIGKHKTLHTQRAGGSPVLHADKGTLLEYKNSEATPLRMSLAHWIKQFPAQVSQVLRYTKR